MPQAHDQCQQDVTKDGTVFLQGIKNCHLRQKAQKEHCQSIQGHLGCGILYTLQSYGGPLKEHKPQAHEGLGQEKM